MIDENDDAVVERKLKNKLPSVQPDLLSSATDWMNLVQNVI